MNTATKNKITIMLDAQVLQGLREKVGARGIGKYLSDLAKPYVVEDNLEEGYKAMAADEEQNKEADEWCEGVQTTVTGENNW